MNNPGMIAAVVGGIAFVAGSVGLYFTQHHVEVAQDPPRADHARCDRIEANYMEALEGTSKEDILSNTSMLMDCIADGYKLSRLTDDQLPRTDPAPR